jgi:hypothetical protein
MPGFWRLFHRKRRFHAILLGLSPPGKRLNAPH